MMIPDPRPTDDRPAIDPSTWSASDRDRAVQMIANLAELLGCPPSNVEAEVRRLVARSATLKRAADPSILADLEADETAVVGTRALLRSRADEARATFRATVLGACGLFTKGEEVRKVVASGRDAVLVSDSEEVGRVPAEQIDFASATPEQWEQVLNLVRSALKENIPGIRQTEPTGTVNGGLLLRFAAQGARVVVTIYKAGAVTTGGPEGELRADVRTVLASLGFVVRC